MRLSIDCGSETGSDRCSSNRAWLVEQHWHTGTARGCLLPDHVSISLSSRCTFMNFPAWPCIYALTLVSEPGLQGDRNSLTEPEKRLVNRFKGSTDPRWSHIADVLERPYIVMQLGVNLLRRCTDVGIEPAVRAPPSNSAQGTVSPEHQLKLIINVRYSRNMPHCFVMCLCLGKILCVTHSPACKARSTEGH